MAAQVWGIRYSPDESKIAIGFGPLWNFDPRPRHVVVVTVDHPQTAVGEFELNTNVMPYPSGGSIAWSPSGAALILKSRPPTMLRWGQEAPCSFSEDWAFGGFLSEDRLVLYHNATIRILRSDCSLADSWELEGRAEVLDTSPEQDLFAIQIFLNPPANSAIELVDSRRHEIKQRWIRETSSTLHGGFLFVDQGRLVCSANHREGKQGPDGVCWDTQTGAKTMENAKISLDQQGMESTGGNLLAITDYKYISHQGKLWAILDMNNDYSVPQRQLIWNVRTGKEVASWGFGGLQQKELRGKELNGAKTIRTRFVLSLSPTGKYVVEGGAGSVSAYALEP
jgi:hypothetical protein